MDKIQRFNVAVRLPEKNRDGNEVNRLTECDVVRAIRANVPMMAIVEAEETHEDTESIRERIHDILRRYFECDDNGNENPQFDDSFTAGEAIDEIHSIVGEFFAKPR